MHNIFLKKLEIPVKYATTHSLENGSLDDFNHLFYLFLFILIV